MAKILGRSPLTRSVKNSSLQPPPPLSFSAPSPDYTGGPAFKQDACRLSPHQPPPGGRPHAHAPKTSCAPLHLGLQMDSVQRLPAGFAQASSTVAALESNTLQLPGAGGALTALRPTCFRTCERQHAP